MHTRCTNPNHVYFKYYGARGIKVCERWDKFENFFADMGPRPSPTHTLERKNNDLGYFKRNCRWATRKEQNQNMKSTHWVTFRGKTKALSVWCEELSIPYARTVRRLLYLKWSIKRALTTPHVAPGSHCVRGGQGQYVKGAN